MYCKLFMKIVLLLQNATTQSLLSVVNGILDESIERKKGEIPHVSLLLISASSNNLFEVCVTT
jgi:hypothetical protein